MARLTLKYPSLNLVRGADGHWNVESLLWKVSRTPSAPTSSRRPEARLRFPYIAAENGRINFQRGIEKGVFSLIDADFSLWSPAENEWRMRLEARPVRTDRPISDTGIVRLEAAIHRADELRDMPVQITASWERAQIGQLTKLVSGQDFGWRGGVSLSAQLTGSPHNLHFDLGASVDDLRRYDVYAGAPLLLSAQCNGTFSSSDNSIPQLHCRLPVGDGRIALSGSFAGLESGGYDISLYAENLPAADLTNIARHVKHELAPDLTAAGSLTASFHLRRRPGEAEPRCIGYGTANGIIWRSSVLEKDLAFGTMSFSINASNASLPRTGARPKHAIAHPALQTTLRLTGSALALGGKEPAHLAGELGLQGFDLHISGAASVQRLLQAARALGVSAPKISLLGDATLDLQLTGGWLAGDARLAGGAQLHNAKAEIPGLASPLELEEAHVSFTGDRMNFRVSSGVTGKTHFTGTVDVPRSCMPGAPCASTFDLQFEEIDVARWNAELNPRLKKRPWYRIFGSSEERNVVAAHRGLRAASVRAASAWALRWLRTWKGHWSWAMAAPGSTFARRVDGRHGAGRVDAAAHRRCAPIRRPWPVPAPQPGAALRRIGDEHRHWNAERPV